MDTVTIHVCPNGCNSTFATTAHVVQDWEVDALGNFVDNLGGEQTLHGPDNDNIWTCQKCGAEAKYYECLVVDDESIGRTLYFPKNDQNVVFWSKYGTAQIFKAPVQHDSESGDAYIFSNALKIYLNQSKQ